ncbi:MAG: rod shape-determining protein MreD [Paraprevotella sp.]|nr:rod shape-determining protein MreD [Paraprevotella sp.]
MILTQLKRLTQLLLLLALQTLILNHMSLWGMGTPMVGVLLLVYLPMDTSRTAAMLWGFSLGLLTDIFSNTPGMGSAAMTLAAMLRPSILDMQAPKDAPEDLLPTYQSMGIWNHIRYIFILFLVHHTCYFMLESFSVSHIRLAFIHLLASMATSLLVALSLETLRSTKR